LARRLAGLLAAAACLAALAAPQPVRGADAEAVSLVQLIATPERFDGKRVIVSGVAKIRIDASGLFLSEADADHDVTRNAIWLAFGREVLGRTRWAEFNRKYVYAVGTFRAGERGRLEAYSGALVHVERIDRLPSAD
jgi:hypothetical protein